LKLSEKTLIFSNTLLAIHFKDTILVWVKRIFMKKDTPWKFVKKEVVFESRFLQVDRHEVITPSGGPGEYYIVNKEPSAFIVPILPDGNVLLINVYRYPTQKWSWEVPAGGSEEGDLMETARRELWEETGYESTDMQFVGKFAQCNGFSNAWAEVFVARELVKSEVAAVDHDGIGKVQAFSWGEIREMIQHDEITDGQSIAALMKVSLSLE
jgi:8-oxo-dGTP pyrophosphatase MutT (NUDIX family)